MIFLIGIQKVLKINHLCLKDVKNYLKFLKNLSLAYLVNNLVGFKKKLNEFNQNSHL